MSVCQSEDKRGLASQCNDVVQGVQKTEQPTMDSLPSDSERYNDGMRSSSLSLSSSSSVALHQNLNDGTALASFSSSHIFVSAAAPVASRPSDRRDAATPGEQFPPTSSTANLPVQPLPSPSASSFWGNYMLPILTVVWKFVVGVVDFLRYDDDNYNTFGSSSSSNITGRFVSAARTIVKICLTIVSLVIWYPSLMGHMVGALFYLLDHKWYILVVTTSLAILLVSLAFTFSYEWMWRWQDSCCNVSASDASITNISNSRTGYTVARTTESHNDHQSNEFMHGAYATTTTTTARNRSRFVVTVHDDDGNDDELPFMEWIWKIVKKWALGLACWFLYSVLMTKLSFRLWMEYDLAHDRHGYLELRLVNMVMSMFFLLGTGSFHWYYFPTNRHVFTLLTTEQTAAGTAGAEEDHDAAFAIQTLL